MKSSMKFWQKGWSQLKPDLLLQRAIRHLALGLIWFYQVALSRWLGGRCRFEPSCSCYAKEAFEQHSVMKALVLTIRRLLRCHPLGSHGFDPVPLKKNQESL